MPKFLVRIDMTFSKIVEADSEEDAINKAPIPPQRGDWDDSAKPDYEAEPFD